MMLFQLPKMFLKIHYFKQVNNLQSLPLGIALFGSFKSPLILAPAKIPMTDGKNTENTEKKFSPSSHFGHKFALITEPKQFCH